jgi:ADP-ribose pyrophosphatase
MTNSENRNKRFLPKNRGKKEIVFQNKFHKLYHTKVDFDGFSKDYFVNDHGERIAVLVLKEQEVLLVRQYRYLINDLSYELPGGGVKNGESFKQAIIRECFEETGIEIENLKQLFDYNISLDTLHNYTRIFYTSDFKVIEERISNPKEVVEHLWIPLERCLEMITTKEIIDSMTIMGLLYYSLKSKTDLKI